VASRGARGDGGEQPPGHARCSWWSALVLEPRDAGGALIPLANSLSPSFSRSRRSSCWPVLGRHGTPARPWSDDSSAGSSSDGGEGAAARRARGPARL
jgi:hypothetical protein